MKKECQSKGHPIRNILFALLLMVAAIQITLAQEQPNDRPRQPGGQGQGRSREGGGGGGGRHEMPENKTPVSPNPGQTVGLFLNTPKAYDGYTLFAPKHNMVTYLMKNDGQVVHSWKSAYEPGQVVHLLPNGHLIRACMLRVQGGTGGGEGGRIEEYDWDGNLVWEFDHATREYQLHHDLKPLPNGNILALMVERKTREQAVAAGFDLLGDALAAVAKASDYDNLASNE